MLIAACDEAASIEHTLEVLLADAVGGELDVVVACNGCSDDTADRARTVAGRIGHPVTVLELATASKTAAWRAAEAVSTQPRVYLDADVDCPTATARELLDALDEYDVAVPSRCLRHDHGSLLARLYYQGWTRLPWVSQQLTGRGAFALSRATRATFGDFPDVVADDRFATTCVPRHRAVIVAGEVTVRPPATLPDVVAVRTRVLGGNAAGDVPAHDAGLGIRLLALLRAAARPNALPALVVYSLVTAAVKLGAGRSSAARPWARAERVGSA